MRDGFRRYVEKERGESSRPPRILALVLAGILLVASAAFGVAYCHGSSPPEVEPGASRSERRGAVSG